MVTKKKPKKKMSYYHKKKIDIGRGYAKKKRKKGQRLSKGDNAKGY